MGSCRRATNIGSEVTRKVIEMSDTMREVVPVLFMFGCVLALGPIVGYAIWLAFDGDRLREDEVEAQVSVHDEAHAPSPSEVALTA